MTNDSNDSQMTPNPKNGQMTRSFPNTDLKPIYCILTV